MKYIMTLDQGTTSSRCILFDLNGSAAAMAQREFTQYFPQPGWVEHDPEEIWDTTLAVSREAMFNAGARPEDIVAIGITNQRETTVLWEKTSGRPVANAIVWQCRRTSKIIDKLVQDGAGDMIREKTGLVPDAYFSASKIKWLLDTVPGARKMADNGELLFGTIDSWLIWKLTGGKAHVTDYTNASRTMLFNIEELRWDTDLLKLLDIPECILPEVKPSSCVYGYSVRELYGGEIPIAGAAGDQQSALFGQCCFLPGEMKNTYGTGCFLLMNTGSERVRSKNGLVTSIAVGYQDHVEYALEGSIFTAGSAVQWLRDELSIIPTAADSERIACSVADTAGAYIVPAFTGLGAPYWKQDARGVITGVTRGFSRAHLVRATLESLTYQTHDIVRAMERDAKMDITALRVDGGASANNFLMQFQADILNADVIRPEYIETTALGAAYLAGLAMGVWSGTAEIRSLRASDQVFKSAMASEKREELLKGWQKAVRCALVD